jgi:hypothetical protein
MDLKKDFKKYEEDFEKFIKYCAKSKIELVEYNDLLIQKMMYQFTRYDKGEITLKEFKQKLFSLDPNKRYKG